MRADRRPWRLLATLLLAAQAASAQAAAAQAPAPSLPDPLRTRLDAVLDDPSLARGFTGAVVVAAGTRPTEAVRQGLFGLAPYLGNARPELYARNADRSFVPASNLKLFTTAAALDRLGADHTFATWLFAAPLDAEGGVPALYLVGGGDPSLGHAQLRQLAQNARAAGLRKVRGPVVGDGSRYRGLYPNGWTVDDLVWYYAPEVTGLCLNRNQVDIAVGPGAAVGEPATVSVTPAGRHVRIRNEVRTTAAGQPLAVQFVRAEATGEIVLRGAAPLGQKPISEGVAVIDTPAYAASALIDALRAEGITVAGEARQGLAPGGARELARVESPALGVLIQRLLKRSDNLYAEVLLRELGRAYAGEGTVAAGVQGVLAFLQRSGIGADGVRLSDGSGLSRYNLVTPYAVAGVLRAMAQHPHREAWFAALPIAGVDGTLANRMKGTAAERRVRAKTGYLSGRTSLSGYITTQGGDLLIASTLFNHYQAPTDTARGLHDRFFVALSEWTRP
jgi:D-alanyl-D-alanine carboxypeptidase/D-alanyl-D-alanine-endopeptidase (penicillin-binding protein 4)